NSELPDTDTTDSPMARVVEAVAGKYRVTRKAILGKSRMRNVARARQIAMYPRRPLGVSLTHIARQLGNRDHTTVLHGCDKIKSERTESAQLAQELRDLVASLR